MKSPSSLDADIDAMRRAVARLRAAGIEILSAEVTDHAAPSIHVVEHPEVTSLPARYTRAVLNCSVHYAAPYHGCEVVWISPPVVAQPATVFPSLNTERTAHHG